MTVLLEIKWRRVRCYTARNRKNGAKALAQRIHKAINELGIPHAANEIAENVTVR